MKGQLEKGKPEEVQVIRRLTLSVFPLKGKDDNKRFGVLTSGSSGYFRLMRALKFFIL
jgi:hypothetical protein